MYIGIIYFYIKQLTYSVLYYALFRMWTVYQWKQGELSREATPEKLETLSGYNTFSKNEYEYILS